MMVGLKWKTRVAEQFIDVAETVNLRLCAGQTAISSLTPLRYSHRIIARSLPRPLGGWADDNHPTSAGEA